MKNYLIRNTVSVAFLFLMVFTDLYGTHIIGGEISYQCLGNQVFQISLTVYRDCYNGKTALDDTAYVAVYDQQAELIATLPMLLGDIDTIVQVDNCLIIPSNVCVETTTYRDTIELNPRPGGYQLAYQRCCRNETIQNIISPLYTGATYDIFITEEALMTCNTSPQLKGWPPTFVCVNRPLEFDHSAFDADGDSLVYRLCTPLDGGIPDTNPRPRPALPPPYDTIRWQIPYYSLSNMLGGTPLVINSETGFMRARPATIGQFVVGVAVDEYRNGKKLSSTRRDFQYNVIPCEDITAQFNLPDQQCGNFNINPQNQTKGNPDGFRWKFFDEDYTLLYETSDINSAYLTPQHGIYHVRLIVNPGSICVDSTDQSITIHENKLMQAGFDFNLNLLDCQDSVQVQVNPINLDSLSYTSLEWMISGRDTPVSYEGVPVLLSTISSDSVKITGLIQDSLACTYARSKTLPIEPIIDSLPAMVMVCRGDSVQLNPNFNPNYSYNWTPASLFEDPSVPNPIILSETPTLLSVDISNSTGCSIRKSINVMVLNTIKSADFNFKVTECLDSLVLKITDVRTNPVGIIGSIKWELTGEVDAFASSDFKPEFILKEDQSVNLSMTINPNSLCPKKETKAFKVNPLRDLSILDTLKICKGDSVNLNPASSDNDYTYEWTPKEYLDNPGSANPLASPTETTTYDLVYADSAGFCEIQKSVTVMVYTPPPNISVHPKPTCNGRMVMFETNTQEALLWNWGDGSPDLVTEPGVAGQHNYPEGGNYAGRVIYADSLPCADTSDFSVSLPETPFTASFDWDILSCEGNTATVQLTDQSTVQSGIITDYRWKLSNGMGNNTASPIFQIYEKQPLTAALHIVVDGQEECADSHSIDIPALVIDEFFEDSLISCRGGTVQLNPDFNNNYSYSWSPAEMVSQANLPNPDTRPGASGIISVQLSNAYGCSLQDSIKITIAPEINIQTSEFPVLCAPEELVLYAESEVAEGFIWLDEKIDTLSTEPEFLLYAEKSRKLKVIGQDTFGCTNSTDLEIDFDPILLDFNKKLEVCMGMEGIIDILTSGNGSAVKFFWEFNPAIIQQDTSGRVKVLPTDSTTIIFNAYNKNECKLTDSIKVTINPPPNIFLQAEPDTIYEGQTSQLTANAEGIIDYFWSPQTTLNDPALKNPKASPSVSTVYSVEVEDEKGCINTESIAVYVKQGVCSFPHIFVPSAFTPNGDGENDILYVRGDFIGSLTFIIYDRWGNKVFETRDQSVGWNGKKNGTDLPPGVFGYYLEAICTNGDQYQTQGNITLIR